MIKIFYTMEKLEEIHKEILNGNMDILKDFPLLYCLSENKENFVVLRKGRIVKEENHIKYFFPNSESNESNGIYCLIWGRKNEESYGIGGTPVPDDFYIIEMKFKNDILSLLSEKDEKIEATLKQFNKALQNIWSNFTMEELSIAFRQAPAVVLDEIKKEDMPKTVTIKNFGKFIYNKKLNAYKLFKQFIEKAKDYTTDKLLKLKNDLWLEEDEKEVTKKDFKDRMKFTSLYVFSESANFYFDDGNLFWGHTIEVTINQNLEFIDANIVG